MIRYIDLFAGTGGVRIGLEQAANALGVETRCILSSDIDRSCQETYELNFNEQPLGDIRMIHKIPQFDLLLGGFPCQPFSYAGKQKGFGDTRGTLFFEIERILKKYKPESFLLENVRGLTTHDQGRTFQTILKHLKDLGYGVEYRILNASSYGVAQNRTRVYIVGLFGQQPKISIPSDLGANDSHHFKALHCQQNIFGCSTVRLVKDILEENVDKKYYCSEDFTARLKKAVGGDLEKLHGMRLIDHRNGRSLHSWDLGLRGECTEIEREFMDELIRHRRLKVFGSHQDGKRLSLENIKTFFRHANIESILQSLEKKGYIKQLNGKYNPVAGNMSFEIFKFLDPSSISITLVASDTHKIGVVQDRQPRHITPREAARIQGYPDTFRVHPDDSTAYRQFGNAVAVPVITIVLEDLLRNNHLECTKDVQVLQTDTLKEALPSKAISTPMRSMRTTS